MSIREDLKAYLDGELPPERMDEVRAAIESDSSLREEAEYMRMLGTEIRELSADPEIVGMEQVLGAVTGRGRRNPWPVWNRAWLGVAASLIFVLVIGALAFPLFSQSKMSALSSGPSAMSESKAKALAAAPDLRGTSNSASPNAYDSSQTPARGGAAKGWTGMPPTVGKTQAGPAAASLAEHAAEGKGTVVVASISIEAADVEQAEAAVKQAAVGAGGYVERIPPPATGSSSKQVALSVPAHRLDAALRDIRSIGHVLAQSFSSIDVRSEQRAVASRLAALRQQPARTRSFRDTANSPAAGAAGGARAVDDEIGNLEQRQRSLATDNPMPVIIATIEAVTPGMPPPPRIVPHPAKPKSKLPLVLGCGIAGLVVVVGTGAFLLLRVRRLRGIRL